MIAAGAETCSSALEDDPRAVRRDDRPQARRRWAASSIAGRSPTTSRTASSARVSRSRSTTCSAPATPSCPASCAAGCAASSIATCGDLGQCLRRLRRVAAALLAGISDLRGAAASSSRTAARTGRCARTRRSTTSIGRRRAGRDIAALMALAIDHRAQFEDARRPRRRRHANASARFKGLAVEAAARVAAGRPASACCSTTNYGREALFKPRRASLLDRPAGGDAGLAAAATSKVGGDIGSQLVEWPVDHGVKCLCFYHPDDRRRSQGRAGATSCVALFDAARKVGRELMIEIIAGKNGTLDDDTVARAAGASSMRSASGPTGGSSSRRRSRRGLGAKIDAVIATHDPWCRGVVLLGLEAPRGRAGTRASPPPRKAPMVKGFAVGRTIFVDAAAAWLAGKIDDDEAVTDMAARFDALTEAWLPPRPTSRMRRRKDCARRTP